MERQKILLCGAAGFIGRNLLERLLRRDDCEVYAVYHKRQPPEEFKGRSDFHPVWADLTSPGDVEKVVPGMDVLVQAAATTSGAKDIVGRPYIHVTDNAVMNSLLFRACFQANVRHVVFFSCTVMYPEKGEPVKETDFDGRITEKYFGVGWTKVYVEKMCEFYARIGKTRYTAVRHSNIYGPHDKYDLERSHVFGATVTKVMTAGAAPAPAVPGASRSDEDRVATSEGHKGSPGAGKDGTVVVWGEGTEARDMLYVDDLADLVEAALAKQTSQFELVNAGSGQAVSVADLVRRIIAASGRDLAVEFDRTKPSIPFKLALDCSKARKLFGWKPKHTLEEGIRKTLDWYRENVK